jgi:AraC family transcriptional regulator
VVHRNPCGPAIGAGRYRRCGGLSPFHLSRLFQARTGTSVVRYLRGRRLTAAAQRLANGAGDILQVALGAGYTTHAAFTRAFSEQFGQTPERVREQGTDGLALVQAIRVDEAPAPCGEAPRLLDTPAFQVAGIGMRHTRDSSGAIPGPMGPAQPRVADAGTDQLRRVLQQ